MQNLNFKIWSFLQILRATLKNQSCYLRACHLRACLHAACPTRGTQGHAKFMFLINLIFYNESIMHYFYRLIKHYTLILVKKSDLLSLKQCKQKDLLSV